MESFNLKGKTVLVTGASSGIGRECAISIAAYGARVVITGRNPGRLDETFTLLKGKDHLQILADLCIADERNKLIKADVSLDGIINAAGIVKPFPVKFIGERQIDEMWDVNYKSMVLLNSALIKNKKINNGASFVFISSISSMFGHKGGALYSGTKAGVDAFSRNIALEFSHLKIRSNCINAAMVKTPIFEKAQDIISSESMEEHGKKYPLGFGEPKDIANAAIFLLSDASKWITGTNLVLDGGLTAGS